MAHDRPPSVKHVLAKVCLVGERETQKAALIRRFVQDSFDDKYIQTLGTKVSKKTLTVRKPNDNEEVPVDMTIWDIMGQKGFRELLKEAYFYGAKGILAVCDATRKQTLEDLDDWIEGVYSVTGKIPIVFLANKADLVDQRMVTEEDLKAASAAYGGRYFFTSAATGMNVELAFQTLAELIVAERFGLRAEPA